MATTHRSRPAEPPPATATPENTAIPGGGSWRWDATLPGWVENTPPPPPVTETHPE